MFTHLSPEKAYAAQQILFVCFEFGIGFTLIGIFASLFCDLYIPKDNILRRPLLSFFFKEY